MGLLLGCGLVLVGQVKHVHQIIEQFLPCLVRHGLIQLLGRFQIHGTQQLTLVVVVIGWGWRQRSRFGTGWTVHLQHGNPRVLVAVAIVGSCVCGSTLGGGGFGLGLGRSHGSSGSTGGGFLFLLHPQQDRSHGVASLPIHLLLFDLFLFFLGRQRLHSQTRSGRSCCLEDLWSKSIAGLWKDGGADQNHDDDHDTNTRLRPTGLYQSFSFHVG